ncbi:flippase [Paraferrimonas sedimenticola]|uniref:O-unit flippase Wzx n=1 Tax=Paraferrimonas sedimenticola TaxID=375674 RepID=A0AA37RV88_9GAMM|nr:O-unit flippase Wzx [Paraferrimonas sedimenticola]
MKALINIGWLYLDRILGLTVGIISNAIVARYLGPEQYGTIAYLLALASFLLPFVTLGSDTIIYDCVARRNPKILVNAAFYLRVICAASLALAAWLYLAVGDYSDEYTYLAMALIASVLINGCDILKVYFDAGHRSKINSLAAFKAAFITLLAKITAVWLKLGLLYFGLAYLLQALLVWVFKYPKVAPMPFPKMRYLRWRLVRVLLSRGGYLAFSALSIILYTAMDRVMLGQLLGDQAVGLYAAALHISIGWLFIPGAITLTLMKKVSQSKQSMEHHDTIKHLFSMVWGVAIAVGLMVYLLSDWIIAIIFGEQFAVSAQILQVYVFGSIFAAIGAASYRVLVVHGLYKFCLAKTLIAAVMNLGLNLWLIPKYGVLGAAYATIISEMTVSLWLNAWVSAIPVFRLQCRALLGLPKFAVQQGRLAWRIARSSQDKSESQTKSQ